MTETTAVEDGTREEAATFAALSQCWQYPSEQLVEVIADKTAEPLDELDAEELCAEYTRLFLGPGPAQCPPYESVYRDAEDDEDLGPVRGASTEAIRRWYREYGVEPDPDHPDLPDHVATELEFAAYLAAEEDEETLEQFLDEHPRQWLGDFADRVRDRDPSEFYRNLLNQTLSAVEEH